MHLLFSFRWALSRAFELAGLKLGAHFQIRHHIAFAETKRLRERRAIGDVTLAQIEVSSGAGILRSRRADPLLAGLGGARAYAAGATGTIASPTRRASMACAAFT